jgi:hypothetical protein
VPEPIEALEARRESTLREIAALGDMRKGSITEAFRACGKSACVCHGRGHPGHGPYYAFTTKVGGKTSTVQLRAGSRLDKFQREVETYRRFRVLIEELLEVNGAICDARPAESGTDDRRAALKKTSPESSRRRSRRK